MTEPFKLSNIEDIGIYKNQLINAINEIDSFHVSSVARILNQARIDGRKVYTFGNGGSASTASHFAGDLNKGAIREDTLRFKALCLNDNIPGLMAWANDVNYESVFAEQLNNFIEPHDVIIAISGSGNSKNVLNAVKIASAGGATTLGLTGFNGGKLKRLVDFAIVVPCDVMEIIEDVHLVLCHMITKYLREVE